LLHARNLEGAEDMGLKMLALTQKPAMATLDISPVIGLSAGRGAVAVALDFE
jgi:fatty acid-binding protein DegV